MEFGVWSEETSGGQKTLSFIPGEEEESFVHGGVENGMSYTLAQMHPFFIEIFRTYVC